MTGETLIPAALGFATLAVALTVAARNWITLVRGLRGTERSSPILVMGPLFGFIAGGLLVRGLPTWPPSILWLPGVALLLLDPASLPLLLWLLLRHRPPGAEGSSP